MDSELDLIPAVGGFADRLRIARHEIGGFPDRVEGLPSRLGDRFLARTVQLTMPSFGLAGVIVSSSSRGYGAEPRAAFWI